MSQGFDDLNEQKEKKPFKIKIAGFTFGTKQLVLIGGVVAVIAISSAVSNYKEEQEIQARIEANNKALEEALASGSDDVEDFKFDYDAMMQESLVEQYGQPPEGFKWSVIGELVAIGNDDESTAEDTVYMFVRALSILDFSTASRYSEDSAIITSYQDYYSDISNTITNYYDNFLRKQFKKSLTSVEIDRITDTAVFADGTKYVTLSVNTLDLTNKDFWRDDEQELFNQMRVYKETETDDTKMKQYVYDYIYEKYESGDVGKKSSTIELIVSKTNGSGWLVSGDGELNALLQYESGVDVAQYILDGFDKWYMDVTLEEQLQDMQNQISGVEGD